jgi:hypothetical protein
VSDDVRFIQLTPARLRLLDRAGKGITDAAPGSVRGLTPVVPDINAARAEVVDRRLDVSEVQKFPWGSFVFFSDPDRNRWAVQALRPR